MEIKIKSRYGKPLGTVNISPDTTVSNVKQQFQKLHPHFYPERQWFTIGDLKGAALRENNSKVSSYGLKEGDELVFKDLGVQISWRLVFVIEYLGPILIFLFLYYFPELVYSAPSKGHSFVQKCGLWMGVGHYIKREIETLFIHRFSTDTMPFKRIFINSAHYWLLFGVGVGYFLFHPLYTTPNHSDTLKFILIALFIFAELMNLCCHLVLRNLRPKGSKVRGIPIGFGFGYISCANYYWETVSWVIFSIFVSCLTSWVFVVVAFIQMNEWAQKKHWRYITEFDGKEGRELYPRERRAIIPFLV